MQILNETKSRGILQVKSNQKYLLRACERTAATQGDRTETSHDTTRNRDETRTVTVFTNLDAFIPEWSAYVTRVVCCIRHTRSFDTRTKVWKETTERSFYIANWNVDATEALSLIREHWAIENRNHYVRDVSLLEDASRIRKNPDRFTCLRSFALNILRANDVTNVKSSLYENAISLPNFLEKMVY